LVFNIHPSAQPPMQVWTRGKEIRSSQSAAHSLFAPLLMNLERLERDQQDK